VKSQSVQISDQRGLVDRRMAMRIFAGILMNAGLVRAQMPSAVAASAHELRQAARRSGILLSVFTGMHQIRSDLQASTMIAETFDMIADGNDLKFSNRLRPTPDNFDFSFGDSVVSWARENHLRFRGHCLIWWNALPRWFGSYVTLANARDVLCSHITTVLRHYAGRVYSWDVVNEPIYHDNRPDGLRRKPWLDLLGPEYIDLAFHTAAAADPEARLILNECYIEHDTPAEAARRDALLALLTRLKRAGVPVSGLGIQGHLRGATPLDRRGLTRFLEQIRGLGLDIAVTELDVDEIGVPAPQIAQAAASKIGEFLDIVSPYVGSITLEALSNEPYVSAQGNGNIHTQNLFDEKYKPTLAYGSAVRMLNERAQSARVKAENSSATKPHGK
jgi:endo-1,4-beta-xylanase